MALDNNEDPWLALDKLYHVLFCFFLVLIFSKLASLTRFSFIRRLSVQIGSIISLCAGAAKEGADHLGFFRSAGASAKDAAADLLGVLIAVFILSMYKMHVASNLGPDENRRGLAV